MSIRYTLGYTLVVAATVVTVASSAGAPTYSMSAHIVSSGTSVHALSACFGLDAVIAEPIAGFSSGGAYVLSAGFDYAATSISDTIFADRFEDCSP